MQLSTKVLLGLGLGIVAGLFFGEMMAPLKIAGDVFILSLQMTVLPYIMVSLISGLGSLSYSNAILLLKKCGWVILTLWIIGIIMVLIFPLAFPSWAMASFFSTSQIESKTEFNYLGFYIPSNIFYSLSNNIVPAVVVFSVAMGIALISIKEKNTLINILKTLESALGKIAGFLVSLAPYGVFAIIASSIGVISFDEIELLQVYMLNYVVFSLLLTFWILPMLVTSLTSIRYKDLLSPVRTALVTAFATGNIFIVLPLLSEKSKSIINQDRTAENRGEASVDVVIPASFSFPNMGKILSLSFVLFAGWFANSRVPLSDYPTFAIMGFFSYFGDLSVAIPSLLNIFHIPSDTFRFFLVADNLAGTRFGTLLAAMYTLVLAVLSASGINGQINFNGRKLFRFVLVSVILTIVSVVLLRLVYAYVIRYDYKKYEALGSMMMSRKYEPAIFSNTSMAVEMDSSGSSHVERIRNRGFIKVGYFPDALPFVFTNSTGELVGYDIEMAHILAEDMNVKLQLIPIKRGTSAESLQAGIVDIVMSGIAVTLDNAVKMELSAPYINQTFAFIVKDYRLQDFNSREKLQKIKKMKIGTLNTPYYISMVKRYLPQAEIVIIESPKQFFELHKDDLDAFIFSAEAGSAWCLIYPQFSVAIPYPDILEVPIAYGMNYGDLEFKEYIDTWIELKENDKTTKTLYDHWILGKQAGNIKPRWSIIRDVLKWKN